MCICFDVHENACKCPSAHYISSSFRSNRTDIQAWCMPDSMNVYVHSQENYPALKHTNFASLECVYARLNWHQLPPENSRANSKLAKRCAQLLGRLDRPDVPAVHQSFLPRIACFAPDLVSAGMFVCTWSASQKSVKRGKHDSSVMAGTVDTRVHDTFVSVSCKKTLWYLKIFYFFSLAVKFTCT